MAHRAVLYTRKGCCLCLKARDVLARLEMQFEMDVEEIDIDSDPVLAERYGNAIPVVLIDGVHLFESKIAEHYIRRVLEPPTMEKIRWPWRR